ncbi:MAG: sugar MFS transporter [Armatimonadota bacterium]
MSDAERLACRPIPEHLRLAMSLVALALAMVSAYGFVTFPVYAHGAQEHFGITEGRLGLLLSSGAIGSLFSLLLVGPATDRLGSRRMVRACLAGSGLAYLVCGIGRSLLSLQIGLILAGFFGAAMAASLPAFLICQYPAWRRRMVTISLVAIAAPGVIFPLIGQWLLSRVDAGVLGFAPALHLPFLAAGIVLVGGQFILHLGRVTDEAGEGPPADFRLRSILSCSALVIIVCAMLHAGSDNGLYGWLPTFMERRFDSLPIGTGLMLGLYSLAYAIARLFLAALPEGFGQRAFLRLPGPIGGGLIIAVIWLGGPLAIGVVYPLVGLLVALEFPALLAEIRETTPARFSAIYAASIWSGNLLGIANANLIGQIGERTGDLRIGLTLAACGFIGFGVIALVTGMGRHEAAGADAASAEQAADAP